MGEYIAASRNQPTPAALRRIALAHAKALKRKPANEKAQVVSLGQERSTDDGDAPHN